MHRERPRSSARTHGRACRVVAASRPAGAVADRRPAPLRNGWQCAYGASCARRPDGGRRVHVPAAPAKHRPNPGTASKQPIEVPRHPRTSTVGVARWIGPRWPPVSREASHDSRRPPYLGGALVDASARALGIRLGRSSGIPACLGVSRAGPASLRLRSPWLRRPQCPATSPTSQRSDAGRYPGGEASRARTETPRRQMP